MYAFRLSTPSTPAFALALAAQLTLVAAQSPDIAGKWDLTVKSPHGDVMMGLDLTVSDSNVNGTLLNFRGEDLRVTGTYANGELTLATKDDDVAIAGKPAGDGSLRGMLSTPHGDLTWTAVRPKKTDR